MAKGTLDDMERIDMGDMDEKGLPKGLGGGGVVATMNLRLHVLRDGTYACELPGCCGARATSAEDALLGCYEAIMRVKRELQAAEASEAAEPGGVVVPMVEGVQ